MKMEPRKFIIVGILSLTILLVGIVNHAHSANILALCFFCGKSNKITWINLIEELGKRGHTVTFVTPFKPQKEMKNVKEILTVDGDEFFKKMEIDPYKAQETGQGGSLSVLIEKIHEMCRNSYDLPQVKALLDEKFDLVLHQPLFNDCVLGLIHRLQAPFVLFTPTAIPTWFNSKIGGHFPPSMSPNFMLSYPREMNFLQRFTSFGADMAVEYFISFVYEPGIEQLYREKMGADVPSINDILANASLALSNGHFTLAGPSPYLPDVVEVGGIHSRAAKPIPKELEDFIGKGKDGFILFSMGSVIKPSMMPEHNRKMLINVFSKLKQQVIWKWDEETMPDLPKNVKLSKWVPQQDLLGHKDIKMFITHCGGGSTEEAIFHGVPLIGIPMQADQLFNAKNAKNQGMIVDLKWTELTDEAFMGAIQEVLNNPIYRDNAKRISTLFKDRPMDPLKQGIYWIEYVLRHKGAPHLRSAGRKLNTLQYHSYDVIGTYLAIIGAISYVVFTILRFICRKLCCRSGNKSKQNVLGGKKTN